MFVFTTFKEIKRDKFDVSRYLWIIKALENDFKLMGLLKVAKIGSLSIGSIIADLQMWLSTDTRWLYFLIWGGTIFSLGPR